MGLMKHTVVWALQRFYNPQSLAKEIKEQFVFMMFLRIQVNSGLTTMLQLLLLQLHQRQQLILRQLQQQQVKRLAKQMMFGKEGQQVGVNFIFSLVFIAGFFQDNLLAILSLYPQKFVFWALCVFYPGKISQGWGQNKFCDELIEIA